MLRLARLLLYVETAAVVLGLGWFHGQYIGFYDYADSFRFGWSFAYIGLLAVVAYGVGLPDLPRNVYQALWSGMGAAIAGAVGISLVQLMAGSQLLPRFVVFWSALFLVPAWALTGFLAARARRGQRGRDRVVVVARQDEAAALETDLRRRPERRAAVAAVVAPGPDAVEQVQVAVAHTDATLIVLSREVTTDDALVDVVAQLHESGIRVRTLSLFYDEWLGKLPHSELERIALMFDIGEIHRARYGRVKRALDAVVGLVLTPIVLALSPLVLLGNLAGNRGPLFFRQRRIGRGNKEFTIWKFRTMRPSKNDDVMWTAPGDPRITPFGRFLRTTHLDELPQALNLLRGDLASVGPRPEQPTYVEELADKIRFYRLRHLVRPGITGWAQVKYDYGASDIDAMEKLQYEFWYLRHQGLLLDVRILGRTLRSVIGRTGH